MGRRGRWSRGLVGVILWLGILAFGTQMTLAQETGFTSEQLRVLEEKVRELEKPQLPKEPEPSEEVLEIAREYIYRERPGIPATTLEVRQVTGVLAPYVYPGAMDTLERGWRVHRVGPFRLIPYFGYDSLYRSNLYQTTSDKQAVWLHLLSPGLKVELPWGRRHSLSFAYLGNYFLYSRLGNNSHTDHNINAEAKLNFRGGLEVRGGAAYRNAVEERTATTERQRPYQRFSPYVQATYGLADKWRIQGNYQYDLLQFSDVEDDQSNRRDNNIGVTLYYKFWPKTSVLMQYLLQRRDYPNDSQGNNLSQSPFIGFTWDPTPKISGTVKFGYTWKNYDTKIPDRDNNPNSWSMSIQGLYRYSRYSRFALVFQRSTQEDLDFGNNSYENTAFYLTWNKNWHFFKVDSEATFSFANNNYTNDLFDPGTGSFKKRQDNLVSVGVGLSRPLTPYLKFRVFYRYENRSSNFTGLTYNEHVTGLGVQSSF